MRAEARLWTCGGPTAAASRHGPILVPAGADLHSPFGATRLHRMGYLRARRRPGPTQSGLFRTPFLGTGRPMTDTPDKPLAFRGARSRGNRERPANRRVSSARQEFAQYRAMRAVPARAIESGSLQVFYATALPLIGERTRLRSRISWAASSDRPVSTHRGVRGHPRRYRRPGAFGAR